MSNISFGVGGVANIRVIDKESGKVKHEEEVHNLITDWGMSRMADYRPSYCFYEAYLSQGTWSADTSLSHWVNDFGGSKVSMPYIITRPDGSGRTNYSYWDTTNEQEILNYPEDDSTWRVPGFVERINEDPTGRINPIISYWGYAFAGRRGGIYRNNHSGTSPFADGSHYHVVDRIDVVNRANNTGLQNINYQHGLSADGDTQPWMERHTYRYTSPGSGTYKFIGMGENGGDDMFSRIPINGGAGISVVNGDIIDLRYEFKINIANCNRETDYDPSLPYLGAETDRNFPETTVVSEWGTAKHGVHCLQYAMGGLDSDRSLAGVSNAYYSSLSPAVGTEGSTLAIKLLGDPTPTYSSNLTNYLGTNIYSGTSLYWNTLATSPNLSYDSVAQVGSSDTWRKTFTHTFGDMGGDLTNIRAMGLTSVGNGAGNRANSEFFYMWLFNGNQTKPNNKDLNITLNIDYTRS
jgi:hypothetical protein